MSCKIHSNSIFKVLSFSTEMQSSTDFALINTKVNNSTQMITEVNRDTKAAARGNRRKYSV